MNARTLPLIALLLALPSILNAQDLRWGAAVGLVGHIPVGDDTGQDSVEGDEFGSALWIHADLFLFQVNPEWHFAPFVRAVIAGGADADTYARALGDTASGEATTGMTHLGIGARYSPLALGQWRGFLSAYLGHATARVTYSAQNEAAEQLPEEFRGLLGSSQQTRRHTGMAVTAGLGLRRDLGASVLSEDVILPISIELQWTKNVWLDLEGGGVDSLPLAEEGMQLDYLSLLVSVGFLR